VPRASVPAIDLRLLHAKIGENKEDGRGKAENVGIQHHSVRHRPNAALFSAAAGPHNFGLSRRHFGSHLWTSRMASSCVRFSEGPVFSEAVYFADLVQSLKSPNCQILTKSRVRKRTRSATATRR